MKENKFRGKRFDNGFLVYGYYVFCRKRHYILPYIEEKIGFDQRYQEWIEVDPATVGQYTGLKDGKRTEEYPEGQEIYEGDIVRCCGGEHCQGYREFDHTIEIKNIINDCFMLGEHEELRVLGNRWDNPELLT